MKVTIKGEEKVLQPLKGRVVKKIRNKMFDVMKTEKDSEQADAAKELLEMIDEEAALIAGMKVVDLDELDIDEKTVITKYIVDKINSTLDFLKSSSPQANSSNKTT